MSRRKFIKQITLGMTGIIGVGPSGLLLAKTKKEEKIMIEKIKLSKAEWKEKLTDFEYEVLRREGTEPAFSHAYNDEKREGVFLCRGCDLELFKSETKYDSGTGWPSFFDYIEGHVETKLDFKLIYPRTEYHCARCEGHQGHVFKDGPEPTGLRYCNNGVALKFIPSST